MTINKELTDDKLKVLVEGRLDSVTSPELEESLNESIEGITDLTIDFTDLEYISSAGLRVLLSTMKKMKDQGYMRVVGINEEVKEIFEVTGFSEILNIE